MDISTCYEILGVAPGSDLTVIRKAYLKLSLKWHPDHHQTETEDEIRYATEKFQTINEAYNTLNDYLNRTEDQGYKGSQSEYGKAGHRYDDYSSGSDRGNARDSGASCGYGIPNDSYDFDWPSFLSNLVHVGRGILKSAFYIGLIVAAIWLLVLIAQAIWWLLQVILYAAIGLTIIAIPAYILFLLL